MVDAPVNPSAVIPDWFILLINGVMGAKAISKMDQLEIAHFSFFVAPIQSHTNCVKSPPNQ